MQELYNFMMRKVVIWNATYGEITGKKLSADNMKLDFIKPIKEAKTEKDVIKLHHYSNMQFLWPRVMAEKKKKEWDKHAEWYWDSEIYGNANFMGVFVQVDVWPLIFVD